MRVAIHSLTNLVLPKPAEAEMSVTPGMCCSPAFSRSSRRGRSTTFGRGGGI
jgi:hypothetical protein